MSLSKDQILEILKGVKHPSTGKDIVSSNIVQNLKIESTKISFDLSFAQVNDPMKSSLKKACETILKNSFDSSYTFEVNIKTNLQLNVKKEEPILPGVKNIIAVSSGKGGVGKSTVAVNLAVAFAISGAKVGLIDADIFGPSIPKMLGTEDQKPVIQKINGKDVIVPVEKHGIKALSIGYFVDPDDATIWRGPMASNALGQLIKDAHWGELDYLFIDLPPGTSDIHLTLVQTVPVTGAIVVSTPQQVALADAKKGISMFRNDNINVPVLGLIENMAWFTPAELPENKYFIFGENGGQTLASKLSVPFLGQIPIVQSICENGDNGTPSVLVKDEVSEAFKNVAENIRIEVLKRVSNLDPTQKVEIKKRSFSDFKK